MDEQAINIQLSRVHNLKAVSCRLPHNQFYCLSGVSGSGKSSFAFDTIFVEGQRRYVESLSHQAKRLFGSLPKPDVESITGLTPTISIEQKSVAHNPRSTVGTLTEIYDYLRILFARLATAYCPISLEPVVHQTKEEIVTGIFSRFQGKKAIVLAPWVKEKKGALEDDLEEIQRKGFSRVRLDGKIIKIEDTSDIDPNQEHDLDIVIDRILIDEENKNRAVESFFTALDFGKGMMMLLDVETDHEELFSTHAYSKKSGLSYGALEPHDFSFNSPSGMCPECHGLGQKQLFQLDKVLDPDKSIRQDCCSVGSSYNTVRYKNIYDNLAALYDFSIDTPFRKLPEKAQKVFLYGTEKKWTRMLFIHPETGATWYDTVQWRGILNEAYQRYQDATSEGFKRKMEKLMSLSICPACQGSRLKPYPSHAKLFGKTIREVVSMTISEAYRFFSKDARLSSEKRVLAQEVLENIASRLHFLEEVGLGYLTLDRAAPTLSGGEAQRVRLASQIGSGLVGVTYVLDEPSIGLHPHDNKKLINSLVALKKKGNTVIVVEHDEETLRASDTIIDFGPGAGENGGEILFMGTVDELRNAPFSHTKDYLFGNRVIERESKTHRKSSIFLTIAGARHNNLKNITLRLPLGIFVGVTGLSGSGKSSLFLETLFPALSKELHNSDLPIGEYESIQGIEAITKVIQIDQSPIGRTPRSNPATYSKVFDDIRTLFSSLPESKANGWEPGRFSFNVKEGSCPECVGMGMIKVDMDFLEESWVDCPSCLGQRFDNETLSVRYKGKSIQDVLDMTCHQAFEFFEAIPSIRKKLSTLCDVGLDYLRLGQSSTTLSGGEAQRLKLAKELARPDTGNTLYLLDEPTTGLHFHDIQHLMNVLQKLVDRGNSVVVIEHNMDLIKECDWIIDMGPSSGNLGGEIIFEGTPEKIIECHTPTGLAVKEHLALMQQKRLKKNSVGIPTFSHPVPNDTHEEPTRSIIINGASQNNLKSISLHIPRGQITTIIGPSGAGKSSLAFETIYAEGQRRYVESLSPYARQFVKQMAKPKVHSIQGISPAIAIEQRQHAGNPRSTVGTITEIYDYLRIIWARLGQAYCPKTGKPIQAISKESIAEHILSYEPHTKIEIFAPIHLKKGKNTFTEELSRFARDGFTKIRIKDTLYNLDDISLIPKPDPKRKVQIDLIIDRFKPTQDAKKQIVSSLQLAAKIGHNTLGITVNGPEKRILYNLSFSVEGSNEEYPEVIPQTFAFNTKHGMCHDCKGLGYQLSLDLKSLPLPKHATVERLIRFFMQDASSQESILSILSHLGIEHDVPVEDLQAEKKQILFHGSEELLPLEGNSSFCEWLGLNTAIEFHVRRSTESQMATKESFGEDELASFFGHDVSQAMKELPCPSCFGTRLNPLARNVLINGLSITQFCDMMIRDALRWTHAFVSKTALQKPIRRVFDEIIRRLECMEKIGIDYLSLSRSATTLSGGEAQRVRLVSQIGSGLTGVLYVLDEPTIGLHPHDAQKLIRALQDLKKLNNTVVIVEHDPDIMAISDHIIELGPEGGKKGGQIVFQGTYQDLLKASTKTAEAIKERTEKNTSLVSASKKKTKKEAHSACIRIEKATTHNLRISELNIPHQSLVSLAGVSGSGKSTLLFDVILQGFREHMTGIPSHHTEFSVQGFEGFHHVIVVDQKPLSNTSRSDLATYSDLLTPMRHFFSTLPDAQKLGLEPKNFSAYHRKGMCAHCWGLGYKRISMHFMPPVQVPCPECKGMRLNPLSLSVRYKGYSMGEVLKLSIYEALSLFEAHPKITKILDALLQLELGYILLGQEMATLSSGEAQRVKVARELAKMGRRKTLFLMDEPTTGLHAAEVSTLTRVLHELIAKRGHSVIAIEHNVSFLCDSDYIIELGPEAGDLGGKVIAKGAPKDIIDNTASRIGPYMKDDTHLYPASKRTTAQRKSGRSR